MLTPYLEVFYGGAGGGGKSDGLLMAALQYVDQPGYSAILLRRTMRELKMGDSLIPRSQEWLHDKAQWSEQDSCWRFPSGALLQFGHIEHELDKYRYSSAAFQFVGFDELTSFSKSMFGFMFARLRRQAGVLIPLRMRAASNPGGPGHEFVKERYGLGEMVTEQEKAARQVALEAGRVFVPAHLQDNPHIDREAYVRSLEALDPITKMQILAGNWSARSSGSFMRREWFPIVDAAPAGLTCVRYWDLAATEAGPDTDPDWTAGCLMGKTRATPPEYYVVHISLMRATAGAVLDRLKQTAATDRWFGQGASVPVVIEQEPGAAGKSLIYHYVKELRGYAVKGDAVSGSKEARAAPFASQAQIGNVKLVAGTWNAPFLDQIEAFPSSPHDDMVDSASGAFGQLVRRGAWILD